MVVSEQAGRERSPARRDQAPQRNEGEDGPMDSLARGLGGSAKTVVVLGLAAAAIAACASGTGSTSGGDVSNGSGTPQTSCYITPTTTGPYVGMYPTAHVSVRNDTPSQVGLNVDIQVYDSDGQPVNGEVAVSFTDSDGNQMSFLAPGRRVSAVVYPSVPVLNAAYTCQVEG